MNDLGAMQRSTQRHSFPFDKMVPKSEMERMGTTTGKKVVKDMHKKKQRQHNQKLIVQFLNLFHNR